MKKESTQKILKELDVVQRKEFTITTNIAKWRGINGTEYLEFKSHIPFPRIDDIQYENEYISFNYQDDNGTKQGRFYVPYENIVMIRSKV